MKTISIDAMNSIVKIREYKNKEILLKIYNALVLNGIIEGEFLKVNDEYNYFGRDENIKLILNEKDIEIFQKYQEIKHKYSNLTEDGAIRALISFLQSGEEGVNRLVENELYLINISDVMLNELNVSIEELGEMIEDLNKLGLDIEFKYTDERKKKAIKHLSRRDVNLLLKYKNYLERIKTGESYNKDDALIAMLQEVVGDHNLKKVVYYGLTNNMKNTDKMSFELNDINIIDGKQENFIYQETVFSTGVISKNLEVDIRVEYSVLEEELITNVYGYKTEVKKNEVYRFLLWEVDGEFRFQGANQSKTISELEDIFGIRSVTEWEKYVFLKFFDKSSFEKKTKIKFKLYGESENGNDSK